MFINEWLLSPLPKQREIFNAADKLNLISTTNNGQAKVFPRHENTGHFKIVVVKSTKAVQDIKNTAEKKHERFYREIRRLFHCLILIRCIAP